MFRNDRALDSVPLHLLYEEDYEIWRKAQSTLTQTWLTGNQFRPERNKLLAVPNVDATLQMVVLGLGKRTGSAETIFWNAAGLSERLPSGNFHIADSSPATLSSALAQQFAQGWLYGRYRFDKYRFNPSGKTHSEAPSLLLPAGAAVNVAEVERLDRACTLARDLVNTPANDLSPVELTDAALDVARKFNATSRVYVGDELLVQNFPAVHAVGRASHVAPRLIDFSWGDASHPKVTLVGKGVCFDTGSLDLKPSASMLLMKKDMGGAAGILGLAQTVMDAQLPVQLRVIIPAVENSVSGNAFRPGDVLKTRRGFSIEIGNTDAEGRLILADALTLADAEQPDLIVDFATLTGAARVALGPELPALFTNDGALASDLIAQGADMCDPLWRLPLWPGYDDEFGSKIADINNASSSAFSGAIIGALFLQRFVSQARSWAHIDMYAWNGKERPGRPIGAEPQCIRAAYAYLKTRYTR